MAQRRAMAKRAWHHALWAQTPGAYVPHPAYAAYLPLSPTTPGEMFILIQDAVAEALATAGDDDVMDGSPIPVAHGAWSFKPGWFADIARMGKGGNDRYCYGVRMLMVINQEGVATGWTLASGNVQERWVVELLFSTRAGVPRAQGPRDAQTQNPR